jgi:hypothetical protein
MNPHFASMVLGLAHQAEAALAGQLPPGAEAMPGANARQIAQALIDTLAMLEEKTQGRLDPDESRILTEALTGLRFRFIQSGAGS